MADRRVGHALHESDGAHAAQGAWVEGGFLLDDPHDHAGVDVVPAAAVDDHERHLGDLVRGELVPELLVEDLAHDGLLIHDAQVGQDHLLGDLHLGLLLIELVTEEGPSTDDGQDHQGQEDNGATEDPVEPAGDGVVRDGNGGRLGRLHDRGFC